ncbi:MAG: formate/nitrite transporter [Clostridiales bacterium]|jgi:formate/nitrite transporter|nr:formate/nitrite transporter [Clostridiales bacterium]
MEKLYLTPEEITQSYIATGCKKANLSIFKQFLLGLLAGAFIAFAAEGSNTAIHTIASVGVGKALAGALFATGLMMVVITGGELFTGNTLIVVSCLQGEARWIKMLRNWFFVYLGNFVGSMLIVYLIIESGQFNFSSGLLGGFTLKVATYKTSLTFMNAFSMGILCNWLVCMAVWMSYGAKDMSGKLLAIFFPIWLFITSGFEHSVANMFYIPAGILAKSNPQWVQQAMSLGVTPEKLEHLNWGTFFINNLIPVTLGNIVGGSFFVGMIYWLSFLYKSKSAAVCETKPRSN